jgi:elongation factor Ts
MVKELRALTGAGVLDCKKALDETNGDMEKAAESLRQKGLAAAAKKADRVAKEGLIGSYIHMGARVAALVELNCESDFVARTDDFQALARDLAMQVVAAQPLYVRREDIPAEVITAERNTFVDEVKDSGKSAEVIERMLDGKMEKFYQEAVLFDQPFIKDGNVTIGDLIKQSIARLGENVVVRRFVRYEIGA